jgi:single-stranded DNA-binding protein
VIVTGRLTQRAYQTRDGDNRTGLELQVDEIGPSPALRHRHPGHAEPDRRRHQPGRGSAAVPVADDQGSRSVMGANVTRQVRPVRAETQGAGGSSTRSGWFCPACREQVRCAPPAAGGEDFSHQDGTALCPGRDGCPAEPVEVA